MSYIVLARKYRPHRFTEMVGQEHVVQALSNALTRQRLHHAYLFTGTRGVGKTTVSRILAKSLNCTGLDGQGGITAEPCGQCDACRDIDSGRYVDYVELDAASNRGVDEISQLLDQAVYKPVVGRFKVYMIDEVHMLSTTAFNAMLKTLEEPPEYVKFVLATTDPQKVPVTVLSRCLQFNLRPMAPDTVQEHLARVLEAESVPADVGSLRLLSRAARGSMRDALSLTDQAIAFGSGALEEAAVRQMLGAVDRGHVVRLIEALAAGDGAALVNTVQDLRGLGLSASGTLEELASVAQQMAVLQAVPNALNPNDPDTPVIQALAPRLAADETQLLYSIAIHGRAELALAPDEYSGLTMVLLRMLAFRPSGSAQAAGSAGSAGPVSAPPVPRASLAPVPVPTPAPVPSTPPVAAPTVAPAAVAVSAPAPASSRELLRPTRSTLRVPAPPAEPPAAVPVAAAVTAPSAPVRVPSSSRADVGNSSQGNAGGSSIPPWEEIPDPVYSAPSAPAVMTPVAPAYTEVPSQVGSQPLVTRWAELFTALVAQGGLNGLVRELAWQGQCVEAEETEASSRFVLNVERESLRQSGHRDRLQNALTELKGHPVTLDVRAGQAVDSPAKREQARREKAQRDAEITITQDPMVVDLLARYPGARLVPGSIRPL